MTNNTMKIKRKFALLPVVALLFLNGCSMVESQPLYRMWQARAYGAYHMTPPPHALMQVNFRKEMPSFTGYNAQARYNAQPEFTENSVNKDESNYIAQYYSLQ
jgi:hypothetical protein